VERIDRCSLCGTDARTTLFRNRDLMFPRNPGWYRVHRCCACGVMYLDPRPSTPEELARIYPPSYDSYVSEASAFLQRLRRLVWRSEVREIASFSTASGGVLEIGCATGELLHEVQQCGRRVVGVEYNPEAARVARQRYGIEVLVGDLLALEDQVAPRGPFEVVVMRYVLEHVPDPVGILHAVRDLLAPGGRFVFSIPNPDSFDAALFGPCWYGHDVPRHFHNFPSRALRTCLESAGLVLERVIHSAAPNDWIGSVNYWLTFRGAGERVRRFFTYENPFALALFLPLGLLGKALRRSGRIRVVARASNDPSR